MDFLRFLLKSWTTSLGHPAPFGRSFLFWNMGFLSLNEKSECSSRDLSVNPPERFTKSSWWKLDASKKIPKLAIFFQKVVECLWLYRKNGPFFEKQNAKDWKYQVALVNGSGKGQKKTGPFLCPEKKSLNSQWPPKTPLALAWTLGLGVVITSDLTK